MFRTNSPGSTGAGYFTNGNPATGVPATVVDAPWLNMIQDELEAVLVAAGATPSAGNSAQVSQAIATLIGRGAGFKNGLINGDFDFNQRNFNGGTGSGNPQSRYYTDRWLHTCDSGAGTGAASTATRQPFTLGQTAVPGNPKFHLRHVQTAAATVTNPSVVQRVENVSPWSNATVTFSVWLKAAAALTITARITQNFGLGGAPSAAVLAGSQALAVTTGWQKFAFTVALPSIAGKVLGTAGDHLEVMLQAPLGQTFTLDIARAQLEFGSIATDFEVRPRAVEIALCRRFFEKSYELDTAPGTNEQKGASRDHTEASVSKVAFPNLETRFRVPKRGLPAIAWYAPDGVGGAGNMFAGPANAPVTGTNQISMETTGYPTIGSAPGSNTIQAAHWTADAEL